MTEQTTNYSQWGGFGDLVFKGRFTPNKISDSRTFKINKQDLINGYPAHQNMGEDEHTASLELIFNNYFVDITKMTKQLELMGENGVPRALVVGSVVHGQFCIRKINRTHIETLPSGVITSVNYQIDLVEVRA
ncbi:phage tail protein [Vibrio sp. Vb339]|uniref:phage tail protein n=1 Tax=Vibrio sp. Vb339 TaxID=1192013 RepID=UPI0015560303|nr:phage tail protein [Vibrio sp. Vb339]